MKRKILKKIFIFLLLLHLIFNLLVTNVVYAESEEQTKTDQILQSQKETFGISDFIENAEKYSGDFFDDIDISETLNNAITGKIDNNSIYKKIINLLGLEVTSSIKVLVSVFVIVVIHSILKSISDSLENDNISKIIYYVQYILIVTIIMSNFSNILNSVKETSLNLVGFMNALVPLLLTLMTFTGSMVTSSLIQPIILFMINFIGNIIQIILIPLVLIITVLSIISKISDKVQIGKLSKLLKSGIVWFLGVSLTLFVGVLSLEGTLSSTIDGITAKTTKAAVSTAIPVVGKILGDAVDTVLGCGVVIKNAVGIVGVLLMIGICIAPILKLAVLTIAYNLASAVIEPIADKNIVSLLSEMGGVFKLLLAILCSISVMLIIGITLVIKISNSGMMYR